MTEKSVIAGPAISTILPNASDAEFAQLDNPIWNALRTEHAGLAEGDGLARRYPAAIGPLSGMADTSHASYDALKSLAGPGGIVVLFLTGTPAPPAGWTMVREGLMHQMIYSPKSAPHLGAAGAEVVELGESDRDEMVALATLTEPGPFRSRTMELGAFFGIRDTARLVAMAGMRIHLPGFTEVSAVCTHPEARGCGYGKTLTAAVAARILAEGKTPILHLFAANVGALRVYESVGFHVRRNLELAVLKNED
jgi:ribosomal protein S18 acetylase RimI-like enzyme